MSFVVGTAGHIDHGKSTLVTALTGIVSIDDESLLLTRIAWPKRSGAA